jgi:hypothetical protein
MGHETSFQKRTTISGHGEINEAESSCSRKFLVRDGPDKFIVAGARAIAGSGRRAGRMRLRRCDHG